MQFTITDRSSSRCVEAPPTYRQIELYKHSVSKKLSITPNEGEYTASRNSSPVLTDSSLGWGHFFSRLSEAHLFRVIAPGIQRIGAGLSRAVGGFISAAGAGMRLYQAVKHDYAQGDYLFHGTRKEMTLTAASIGAGLIAAEAGFYLTAGAMSLGAPASVVVVLGVGTATGVGAAVSYTREWLDNQYEQIRGGKWP